MSTNKWTKLLFLHIAEFKKICITGSMEGGNRRPVFYRLGSVRVRGTHQQHGLGIQGGGRGGWDDGGSQPQQDLVWLSKGKDIILFWIKYFQWLFFGMKKLVFYAFLIALYIRYYNNKIKIFHEYFFPRWMILRLAYLSMWYWTGKERLHPHKWRASVPFTSEMFNVSFQASYENKIIT